jgi:site-specific DNA-methyltransferase (adenine-specific)
VKQQRASVLREPGLLLSRADSLTEYATWPTPDCIVSDGAYGVLGFEGDTANHEAIAEWYEPHVAAWAKAATFRTTLWFWNTEIGWAVTHPVLERHGFRYVSCNVWDKGKGHIAGNVSTKTIRRFPVVTEVCAHYVFEPKIQGLTLKQWLLSEWKRSGLPLKASNLACGVRDAATRKYLTTSHLWYLPPPETAAKLSKYANDQGRPEGRPYFAFDGKHPLTMEEWAELRAHFTCPHGVTNVWTRPALRNDERVKTKGLKAVHLNQKPLDLMERLVLSSTRPDGVVWEPFGGLFTASLAAVRAGRQAFGAEIDPVYYAYGVARFDEKLTRSLGSASTPKVPRARAPIPSATARPSVRRGS